MRGIVGPRRNIWVKLEWNEKIGTHYRRYEAAIGLATVPKLVPSTKRPTFCASRGRSRGQELEAAVQRRIGKGVDQASKRADVSKRADLDRMFLANRVGEGKAGVAICERLVSPKSKGRLGEISEELFDSNARHQRQRRSLHPVRQRCAHCRIGASHHPSMPWSSTGKGGLCRTASTALRKAALGSGSAQQTWDEGLKERRIPRPLPSAPGHDRITPGGPEWDLVGVGRGGTRKRVADDAQHVFRSAGRQPPMEDRQGAVVCPLVGLMRALSQGAELFVDGGFERRF